MTNSANYLGVGTVVRITKSSNSLYIGLLGTICSRPGTDEPINGITQWVKLFKPVQNSKGYPCGYYLAWAQELSQLSPLETLAMELDL